MHPAPTQPGKTAGVLLIVAAATALAYAVFGHPLPPLVTAVALLSAVAEFLFPTRCRCTAEGVSRRVGLSHVFLRWERVRRGYLEREGIQLSPLDAPSRLEAFRGLYLPLPTHETERARALEYVRRHCPEARFITRGEETDGV